MPPLLRLLPLTLLPLPRLLTPPLRPPTLLLRLTDAAAPAPAEAPKN